MASAWPAFTLLGDVVASRQVSDRRMLQDRLDGVLEEINQLLMPVVPLEPTIGDEFQAVFANVATAVKASLLVRLALLRTVGVDSRYGLGVGPVQTLGRQFGAYQDGPGWWSAREAIVSAKQMSGVPHTNFVRTCLVAHPSRWGEQQAALNAFLLARDAMVDRMKPVGRTRLYGLLIGMSQSEIAAQEGTTQSAISQNLARSGAFAIAAAEGTLEGGFR